MTSANRKKKEAEKKLGKAHLEFNRTWSKWMQILGAIFVKEEILVIIFSQFLWEFEIYLFIYEAAEWPFKVDKLLWLFLVWGWGEMDKGQEGRQGLG